MQLDSSIATDAPGQWTSIIGVGIALAAFLVALLAPGVETGVTIAVGAVLVAVLAANLAAMRADA